MPHISSYKFNMNSGTAFVPYSYSTIQAPLPARTPLPPPLAQGLDLLLRVVGKTSYGHQVALSNPSPISKLLSPLKGSPSIYKRQFPDLMGFCKPVNWTPIQTKNSEVYPVAIIPNGCNTKNTSQGSQKLISNEAKANAYKRRNVYKSVIRHMFSYIQKNKGRVTNTLMNEGYTRKEVNDSFLYISSLNDLDKQKGKAKRPQNTIKSMLENKNINVYILKETLSLMLGTLNSGLTGKVMRKNTKIYKEVCQEYYNRCLELLSSRTNLY